jgi:heme A synthase
VFSKRFSTYAWTVLFFNVGVILWGAYVRATGSGAGCGSHWPLCDGVVLPRSPRIETVVELSHRLSSGLALLLVGVLFVWALRIYPKKSSVRRGAAFSMVFIITEALVGAGLVLFKLVADNTSMTRAVSTSVHLVNTFLLLGALALTAWWASGGPSVRLRGQGVRLGAWGLALLALLILGMTGSITALGDTLFPPASLAEGLRQDLDSTANFMIRLRAVHPMAAIGTAFYMFLIVGLPEVVGTHPDTKRLAWRLVALFVLQLVAGVMNVVLLAPVWMQMLHLLLADLSWIVLVLLAASALGERASQPLQEEPLTVSQAAT